MNNKLSLSDLSDQLAANAKISKKDASAFLKTLFDLIEENLIIDKIVKINGLGTFKLIWVENRRIANVNTGNIQEIPGHYKTTFTPDSDLSSAVNEPFAHLETVSLDDEVIKDQPSIPTEHISETTTDNASSDSLPIADSQEEIYEVEKEDNKIQDQNDKNENIDDEIDNEMFEIIGTDLPTEIIKATEIKTDNTSEPLPKDEEAEEKAIEINPIEKDEESAEQPDEEPVSFQEPIVAKDEYSFSHEEPTETETDKRPIIEEVSSISDHYVPFYRSEEEPTEPETDKPQIIEEASSVSDHYAPSYKSETEEPTEPETDKHQIIEEVNSISDHYVPFYRSETEPVFQDRYEPENERTESVDTNRYDYRSEETNPYISNQYENKYNGSENKETEVIVEEVIEETPPKKKKRLKYFFLMLFLIALGMAIFFGYSYYKSAQLAEKARIDALMAEPEITPTPKPAPTTTDTQTIAQKIKQIQESNGEIDENNMKVIAKEDIEPGSRLTLLAEKYYGSKIFWVYIYMANKKLIKNPNNVPTGITVIIPDSSVYKINVKDRESIKRANKLSAEILAGY